MYSYVVPFLFWAWYHVLVSAAPILVTAAPNHLGPEVFAGTIVWRLLTNGGIIYLALGELGEKHYLSLGTGYGISLGLAVVGLGFFFMNCDPKFDKSLFWKVKHGRQHMGDCWKDEKIWKKTILKKETERWMTVKRKHATYLPFELITPWICEELVGKYEGGGVERPEWMSGKEEAKFIKRITVIFWWYGKDVEEVNEALNKLFERSGEDLEKGADGQATFIKSKRSKTRIKVEPKVA